MLQKRGAIYYFRWVVPKAYRPLVGLTEITKSLNTSCRLLAAERAARYYCLVRELKGLMDVLNLKGLAGESNELDVSRRNLPNGYIQYMQNMLDAMTSVEAYRDLHSDQAHYEQAYREALVFKERFNRASTSKKRSPSAEHESVYDVALEYFKSRIMPFYCRGLPLEGVLGSDHGKAFEADLVMICKEVNDTYLELFHPDKFMPPPHPYIVSRRQQSSALDDLAASLPVKESSQVKITSASTKLFSEAYDEFIAHKREVFGLSEKNEKEYSRYKKMWDAVLGDIAIEDVKKATVQQFLAKVATFPAANKQPYKTMSVAEFVDLDVPEKDRLSLSTVTHIRKWLQGVFAFCVGERYISVSPVSGVKEADAFKKGKKSAKSRSYANFSDVEMRKILAGADELRDEKAWILRIAAYTGMRQKEILGLVGAAVKQDSETGRYYFLVTDEFDSGIKSDAAYRVVPIHHDLIKAGFLQEFGGLIGDANKLLFKTRGNYLSQWFTGKFLPRLEITSAAATGNRKVFHSFRHTLITKLRSEQVSEPMIRQLVGHLLGSSSVTDRYDHGASIAQLSAVIDSINFN